MTSQPWYCTSCFLNAWPPNLNYIESCCLLRINISFHMDAQLSSFIRHHLLNNICQLPEASQNRIVQSSWQGSRERKKHAMAIKISERSFLYWFHDLSRDFFGFDCGANNVDTLSYIALDLLCSAGTHCSGKIVEISQSLSSTPRQESLFPNTPLQI